MKRLTLSDKVLIQYKTNQLKSFKKLLKKTTKHPTTKRIHQIRVAIRRLRVVLNNDGLRKLARVLGKERDFDMAIKNAEVYGLGTKKLMSAKKRARKKTQRELKKVEDKNLERSCEPDLLVRYKKMIKKLNVELEGFRTMKLSNKQYHQLRITFKKIRYALEILGRPQTNLQKMQDLLGHINDLEILQSLKGKQDRIQKDKEALIKEVDLSYPMVIRSTQKMLTTILSSV